ncbi:MAG: GNAT family N-acetyltransferase [Pseudomonadota bacterium]
MKIRPYGAEDREGVLSLLSELNEYERSLRALRSKAPTLSQDYFRHEYDEIMADEDCDFLFLVAEEQGSLIGYVFCEVSEELLDDPREQVRVLDIMATEHARRHGVGLRLMQAVEQFAADRSITRITLDVLASNAKAIAFYQSLGFQTALLCMEKQTPTT